MNRLCLLTLLVLFAGCTNPAPTSSEDASTDAPADTSALDARPDVSPQQDLGSDVADQGFDLLADALADQPVDQAPDATACDPSQDPTLSTQRSAQINDLWQQVRPQLEALLEPDALRATPYNLYNVQLHTANLLFHIELYQDVALATSLAQLYDKAFDALVLHDEAHFYFAQGSPRSSIHPLATPARMWTSPAAAGQSVGIESPLVSSQFLYAVARLVRLISTMEAPSAELVAFAQRAFPILVQDHYERWAFAAPNQPGFFQRRGWGCANGTFSHTQHLENLLARAYGTPALGRTSSLSYCNAVTDADIWIVAGVTEALEAHRRLPALGQLSPARAQALRTYARLGVELVQARHDVQQITHQGTSYEVAVFDRGAFDDHRDHSYAGFTQTEDTCIECVGRCTDTCDAFPGWKDDTDRTPRVQPQPVMGTGWDISHARRLPPVYDSLWRHRDLLGTTFPTKESIAQLGRQLALVVHQPNASPPQWTNYFDGTNGWYRINYSNRAAFGFAPGAMTRYGSNCSYGFWRPLVPQLDDAIKTAAPKASTNLYTRFQAALEDTQDSLFEPRCQTW